MLPPPFHRHLCDTGRLGRRVRLESVRGMMGKRKRGIDAFTVSFVLSPLPQHINYFSIISRNTADPHPPPTHTHTQTGSALAERAGNYKSGRPENQR